MTKKCKKLADTLVLYGFDPIPVPIHAETLEGHWAGAYSQGPFTVLIGDDVDLDHAICNWALYYTEDDSAFSIGDELVTGHTHAEIRIGIVAVAELNRRIKGIPIDPVEELKKIQRLEPKVDTVFPKVPRRK
jgi:hypothetical protein